MHCDLPNAQATQAMISMREEREEKRSLETDGIEMAKTQNKPKQNNIFLSLSLFY